MGPFLAAAPLGDAATRASDAARARTWSRVRGEGEGWGEGWGEGEG